ncbi:MAG: RNA-directed polymerase [Halanaerobiales bacterium]|nr:RNA-directed polymerase [Halanaerobiales bacterium]
MVITKLLRIARVAKERAKEKFTSLYHLLNEEMFRECHYEMDGKKAAGIDGVTKAEYDENIDENVSNLVKKLKNFSYRPQPALRVYIPKDNGKMRPLGISAYEDKLVQAGLCRILTAIYEQDFLDFSYGFRPGRSCHDALKHLNRIIEKGKISYVVDADIKGFFDNVDHEWLIRFIEHRIADPNIIRLIKRMLKAGIMEGKTFHATEDGTPQGSVVSPVLANIYLHYVLDKWFENFVKKTCRGQAEMVRYADDFVCCFQYRSDAVKFYNTLKKRLNKFKLEIAEEKSKIIEFGRFAEENSKRYGRRTETFDFLGFTHYCGQNKKGKFRVKRKTSRKKYRKKLKEFNNWIKSVRNELTIHEIFEKIRAKLIGHYRYFGITDNGKMLCKYRYEIIRILFKWLNRRSQRKSFSWEKFNKYLEKNPLPTPKIHVNIYG